MQSLRRGPAGAGIRGFVTCRYCNSQLEIKRTESTITTDVLTRIDNNTTSMARTATPSGKSQSSNAWTANGPSRQASLLTGTKKANLSPTAGGI